MVRGYILAGGASKRMGTEKSALRFGDRTLLEIAAAKARAVCSNVAILCGGDVSRAAGLANGIQDLRHDCGPLGGVEAALKDSDADWNLFLAVDTPLIPEELLRLWIADVVRNKEAGASVLIAEGRIQPVPLLLRREALPWIQAALDAGRYKLWKATEEAANGMGRQLMRTDVDGLQVPGLTKEQELARALWFSNGNTPGELRTMEESLSAL